MFLFAPDSAVRRTCTAIVQDKRFDNFILICIIVSSVAMAADPPLDDPDATPQQIFNIMSYVLACESLMSAGIVTRDESLCRVL